MRGRAHVEELRGGKNAIVVTELPYGVKKGGDEGVIAKIADLVKDNVLTEISGLDDHSDKSGMRVEVPERIPERSYITFRADELSLHGTGSVRSCQANGLKFIVGLEFSTGMKWKPKTPESEPAETTGITSDEAKIQTVS